MLSCLSVRPGAAFDRHFGELVLMNPAGTVDISNL